MSGTISLPLPNGETACVAVKVIDPRGNEVIGLHRLEGQAWPEHPRQPNRTFRSSRSSGQFFARPTRRIGTM